MPVAAPGSDPVPTTGSREDQAATAGLVRAVVTLHTAFEVARKAKVIKARARLSGISMVVMRFIQKNYKIIKL